MNLPEPRKTLDGIQAMAQSTVSPLWAPPPLILSLSSAELMTGTQGI